MSVPRTIIGPQWPLAIRYFVRVYSAWAVLGVGTVTVAVVAPHFVATMWRHLASPERTVLDVIAFVALGSVTIFVGFLLIVLLLGLLRATHAADFVGEIAASIEPTSRILSRAEWIDGDDRREGVISCRNDRFFFENADLTTEMNARNIDYELTDRLPNGEPVEVGKRVLRITSGPTSFFYVLDPPDAKEWSDVLNLVVVRRREPDEPRQSFRGTAS